MTQWRMALLATVGAIGLAGCQHLTRFSQWVIPHRFIVRSVQVTPAPANAPPRAADAGENAFYEMAVAAIDQRDYGRALDMLQLARDVRENDPRVLTAMGVVYDKLGRFDLSRRYYDLADAADPGSKVVAADRAYSLVLQRRSAAEQAPPALAAEETLPLRRLGADGEAAVVVPPVAAARNAPGVAADASPSETSGQTKEERRG